MRAYRKVKDLCPGRTTVRLEVLALGREYNGCRER